MIGKGREFLSGMIQYDVVTANERRSWMIHVTFLKLIGFGVSAFDNRVGVQVQLYKVFIGVDLTW